MFFKVLSIERFPHFGSDEFFTFWFASSNFATYEEILKIEFNCEMNLKNFPFDTHDCDFDFAESENDAGTEITMLPITIMYKDQVSENLESTITITDLHLPFNIEIIPKESFETFNIDFSMCTTGVTMKFTRKSLGLLLGGFYGPTAAFSILSMISFFISPDAVSSYVIQINVTLQLEI